jgi:hypothetical protein
MGMVAPFDSRDDRNRQRRRLASANLKSDAMFLEKEARHGAGQI